MLPIGTSLPKHPISGNQMTFFFQILMPKDHVWSGKLISVFSVTDDYVIDKMMPEMLAYNESGYDVKSVFIFSSQEYFKIIASDIDNLIIKDDYNEVLEYQSLVFGGDPLNAFGKINTLPEWFLDDESPLTLDGKNKFDFLFQVDIDFDFKKIDSAPRQQAENFELESGLRDSYVDDYSLFAGNALFLFGEKNSSLIYTVIQS